MRRRLTLLAAAMAAGFTASPASAYMVYVSNEKDNTVSVVDSTTMEVVKTIDVGQRPRGITISHDGKLIYLCASDDDTIEIIDTATHEIVGSLPSGPDPELFVLSPDGKTLYVANEDDNLVTVIDLESKEVLAEVPVGVEPEGMTVSAGSLLFKLVDLSRVWVNAEVPEAQASLVQPGTAVEARVAAYPGAVFRGKVGALLPEVNATTRTLRARIELANPGARLKPGMFATLAFAAARTQRAVLVPSEAVIRTGQRDVVIVALGEGKFRAADVEVGAEGAGQSEIRTGLKPGDKVVLSGQFLIDSDASLSATVARLEGTAEQGAAVHKGRGTVLGVDRATGTVELDHEAIPSLQWPRMSMAFIVEDRAALAKLKKGDAVEFELRAKPDAEGNYVISKIGGKS